MSNKYKRGFSWWAKTSLPQEREDEWDETVAQVVFGFYDNKGNTSSEIAVCWHSFYNTKPVARLEVSEGSWDTLNQFTDVIAKMAKLSHKNPQPDDFIQILLECGIEEITPEKQFL